MHSLFVLAVSLLHGLRARLTRVNRVLAGRERLAFMFGGRVAQQATPRPLERLVMSAGFDSVPIPPGLAAALPPEKCAARVACAAPAVP